MDGFRKFLLVVVCLVYIPLLLSLPVLLSLNATIANPTYIKGVLVKANFYKALSDLAIKQATKESDSSDHTFVITVVKEVASPESIQQIIEPTITNFYVWLEKPEGTPNLTIGLKPIQDKFKQVAEQKLQSQLASLPKCKTPPSTTDPTQLTCIPPGQSVEQIMNQAKIQISQQAAQIGDQEAISLTDDQGQEQPQAKPEAAQKATDTPKVNTNELKRLAQVYHLVKVGTPIVSVLVAVCTLAIVLLSRPIYKALKKIGWSLFTAGILISVTGFGTALVARILLQTPATDDTISQAAQKVAYDISDKVLSINTKFMIGYLATGIILLITCLIITKTKKSEVKKDKDPAIEKDNMLPDDDKQLDDKDDKPLPPSPPKPEKPVEKAPEEPPQESPKTKIAIK